MEIGFLIVAAIFVAQVFWNRAQEQINKAQMDVNRIVKERIDLLARIDKHGTEREGR